MSKYTLFHKNQMWMSHKSSNKIEEILSITLKTFEPMFTGVWSLGDHCTVEWRDHFGTRVNRRFHNWLLTSKISMPLATHHHCHHKLQLITLSPFNLHLTPLDHKDRRLSLKSEQPVMYDNLLATRCYHSSSIIYCIFNFKVRLTTRFSIQITVARHSSQGSTI